ncbi:MAG: hypothetical protein AAB507_00460 [Patescibacteria group bacterium]
MALDEIQNLLREFDEMKKALEKAEFQLQKKSAELESANKTLINDAEELERMNKLMVGRELKMVELKKEIEELKKTGG